MPLRLKPVARSLSVRAEFLGLELEDWGFAIAWAIVMRLVGDQFHRVFLGFLPVSAVMTYGSAGALVLLIRWAKHGNACAEQTKECAGIRQAAGPKHDQHGHRSARYACAQQLSPGISLVRILNTPRDGALAKGTNGPRHQERDRCSDHGHRIRYIFHLSPRSAFAPST